MRERFGGELRPSFRHEEHFRIGFLQTEELRLAEGTQAITLPVSQYLLGVWDRGAGIVGTEGKFVEDDFFKWFGADDQPPSLAHYMTEECLAPHFFIGNEAVREELKKNRDEKFFNIAAERLGRLILTPTG